MFTCTWEPEVNVFEINYDSYWSRLCINNKLNLISSPLPPYAIWYLSKSFSFLSDRYHKEKSIYRRWLLLN